MKKLPIALVLVLVLALSATAIAVANNSTTPSIFNFGVNAASPSQSDDSDPIETLTQNSNFQNHEFEVKEIKGSLKIDKNEAVNKAKGIAGTKISQEAKKITAIKVKFTDNETPQLPEKSIELKDYPVWIVTFHGVILEKHGPKTKIKAVKDNTVLADMNVVIDANSGEELEIFSYPSVMK